MEWEDLKQKALLELERRDLPEEYHKRLKKEFREIIKQGANSYWEDNHEKRFDTNPNGLVLPFLIGMTDVDPIADGIPHNEEYQTDFPDIDLDFVPLSRQTIKDYAAEKYKHVCSVGNWITYKPKSALQDVTRALGGDFRTVLKFTRELPDEFDDLTLEDHKKFHEQENDPDPKVRQEAHRELARYKPFYDFRVANPNIVDLAFRMVGKIKAQGTHAGGLIIADRPIDKIIPLSLLKKGGWTSQWTEGRNTQLSKFGLVKFDILGLKTMYYIWQAGCLIKENHGIDIDWDDMDPRSDPPRAGYEVLPDGTKRIILLDDPEALKMCNELRTDSVFQIESAIQKGIISDGKVKNFWDLVVYNALGRPGPIDMIPEYIKRRDDKKEKWREGVDQKITDALENTFNVIVYQEQLTAIWRSIARFTVPEAEAARKVVAKKWADKLPKVEQKWKSGASKMIGEKEANDWWDKMVTFGRYAFNLAHSVAYSLITYRCLYLKCHYPAEWWAAVMTECHPDKLTSYMGCARLENVKFGQLDVNALSHVFSVRDGMVLPGLQSIKGIGEKASLTFTGVKGPFKNIDDMVEKCGKSKNVFMRLIMLGAFDKIHKNRKGLWMWYQFKYCAGKDITQLRKDIKAEFTPSDQEIELERKRRAENHKRLYPKRKTPKTILNWKPKVEPTRAQVMGMYDDYTRAEKLTIEKEFLGYYWSSPLSLYETEGNTIEIAKTSGVMEVVVETLEERKSKKGNTYYVLRVTDGVQTVPITVWTGVYASSDTRCFQTGVGIKLYINYNEDRNNFTIASGSQVYPLSFAEGEGKNIESAPVLEGEEYPIW